MTLSEWTFGKGFGVFFWFDDGLLENFVYSALAWEGLIAMNLKNVVSLKSSLQNRNVRYMKEIHRLA